MKLDIKTYIIYILAFVAIFMYCLLLTTPLAIPTLIITALSVVMFFVSMVCLLMLGIVISALARDEKYAENHSVQILIIIAYAIFAVMLLTGGPISLALPMIIGPTALAIIIFQKKGLF